MTSACDGCGDPTGEVVAVQGVTGDSELCRNCRERRNRMLAAWGEGDG